MNSELKKLTSKVQKLHESAKAGKNKTAYNLFKEAMAEVMQLEGNGHKSKYTKAIKAILAEYYNKYQSTVKKDTTRVIVEASKAEEKAEKAAEKAKKEERKQLKEIYKELNNNLSHMKESILEHDWASIDFRANQIKKICDKVINMGSVYLSDTGDETAYLD